MPQERLFNFMALDTNVRMPWLEQPNPGEFMLASAQAAQGIGRNFAAAFSEAQEQKRRENVLEKLKPVATAFAATSTPSETLALVQQNPEWMADPDIQPLTSQWLQFQATKQKIVDQTIEGQLAISEKNDVMDLVKSGYLSYSGGVVPPDSLRSARVKQAKDEFVTLANQLGITDPMVSRVSVPTMDNGKLWTSEATRKLKAMFPTKTLPIVPEGMEVEEMTIDDKGGVRTKFGQPRPKTTVPEGMIPSSITIPDGKGGQITYRGNTESKEQTKDKPKSEPLTYDPDWVVFTKEIDRINKDEELKPQDRNTQIQKARSDFDKSRKGQSSQSPTAPSSNSPLVTVEGKDKTGQVRRFRIPRERLSEALQIPGTVVIGE